MENSIDLSPAKWIWFPGERTLANTFVLFRYEFELGKEVSSAQGYVFADSRYKLYVNGTYVQSGPAPHDPRWPEADNVDLCPYLKKGKNVIAAKVLWFGRGEGTYVPSNPGFIFKADIISDGDEVCCIGTSELWKCCIDRSHPAGMHAQGYMRALQEEFDSNSYIYGWNEAVSVSDDTWMVSRELAIPADKPTMCDKVSILDYQCVCEEETAILKRSIPPILEIDSGNMSFVGRGKTVWHREPRDWFDFRIKDSFSIEEYENIDIKGEITVPEAGLKDDIGFIVTAGGLKEQVVGWIEITVDAPKGTVIEIMEQESFDPDNPWLDTHFYCWQRLICKEGKNIFRTYDYYSFMWVQLHIHKNSRPVKVESIKVIRRVYNFRQKPFVSCTDEKLQKVFQANFNTLRNSVQDNVTDGVGRERQQYSGDCSHQLLPMYYGLGEQDAPKRFVRTYGMGQTFEGYFLDCWPANDRLKRLSQRQFHATPWGPILDHGVQYVFDCLTYYMFTGDSDTVQELVPKLIRFCDYLLSLVGADEMIPVERNQLGIVSVWLDHYAYKKDRHKKCSMNLYVSAMLKYGMAALCDTYGFEEKSKYFTAQSEKILAATVDAFWCSKRNLFVDNLPYEGEEGETRISDRSLALSLIFDQCPHMETLESVKILKKPLVEEQLQNTLFHNLSQEWGENLNISYPPNSVWRYLALIKYKEIDTVIGELKDVWYPMKSVQLNNALSEDWNPKPGSKEQWSHCPMSPLVILYAGIAGVVPVSPGGEKIFLQPQGGDFGDLKLDMWLTKGKLTYESSYEDGYRKVSYKIPEGCTAYLNTGKTLISPYIFNCKKIPVGIVEYRGGETISLVLEER